MSRYLNFYYLRSFALLSIALTGLYLSSSWRKRSVPVVYHDHVPISSRVRNSTLGFEEVVVINLKERTDKHDAMVLMAASAGFKFRRSAGVRGETMVPQARPALTPSVVTKEALGCWRAHADVWVQMIQEGWETALIFEDDADWDVRFKDQLELVSEGIRSREGLVRPDAPYGLDWDILFLGQCSNDPLSKVIVGFSYKDESSPVWEALWPHFRQELMALNVTTEGYRTISYGSHPLCLTSYALTRRGALKLLYYVGYAGLEGQVDLAIARHVQRGTLKSLLVTPPLVAQYKTLSNRDSDIEVQRMMEAENSTGQEGGLSTIHFKKSARAQLRDWIESL